MDIPPRISFHGFDASPALRETIEAKIAELERFHPHIVGCEVTIELPHRRKAQGKRWHARIMVSVPGQDIRVTRDAEMDARHEDPWPTVSDAFAIARRQLQDRHRLQTGQTKHHEGHPEAIVQALGADHGFLGTLDGRQLYFHRNAVLHGGFEQLTVGAVVTFVEEEGIEGPQASTVQPSLRRIMG